MLARLGLLCLLLCFPWYSSAKKIPPIIRHIKSQQKAIPVITGYTLGLLPPEMLEPQLRNQRQKLLFNNGHLYLRVDGTGRLYEIDILGDSLRFTRIDSTFYLGDNFNAFDFVWNDTIYSYGGYGFWRSHGMVRRYHPSQHEWEIIRANRQVGQTLESMVWLDPGNGDLYVSHDWVNEDTRKGSTVGHRPNSDLLYSFHIRDGEWDSLGHLEDPHFIKNEILLNSPWGPIEQIGYFTIELFDLKNNIKYQATEKGRGKIIKINSVNASPNRPEFLYFIDSTLYFGNTRDHWFDSVQLSLSDFRQLTKPVYRKDSVLSESLLAGFLVTALLVATGVAFYRRKRSTGRRKRIATSVPIGSRYPPASDPFTEVEKSLLRLLLQKTLQNETTSIEEINRILGLAEKNEAIQKKNRSEVISSINAKWGLIHGNGGYLIDRKRSDFDKRSYEYSIDPSCSNVLADLLSRSMA